MQTDEQLMQQYQAGDTMAFNQLYQRYAGKLYAYLHRHGLHDAQADDVFQQVFYKLHRSQSSYLPKYKFAAWIFTICRNSLIDYYRSRRDHQEFNESQLLLETYDKPTINLPNLSPQETLVISEHYLNEQSYAAMALASDTTEINLRKIASRAIAKLRKKLL